MRPNKAKPLLHGETRRDFLKKTAAAGAVIASSGLVPGAFGAGRPAGVSIVFDPADALRQQKPVMWAAGQLRDALRSRGVQAEILERLDQAPPTSLCIFAASVPSPLARQVLAGARLSVAAVPEALGLVRGTVSGRPVLLACGSDARGLVYALLELADRIACAGDPLAALEIRRPIVDQPANVIRGINRSFVSDVEDKPWFHDRGFWTRYLSMLASQRFNRFSLTFGIGYDFAREIRDCYFYFAYPFLLAVPGYNVRVNGLPDTERDRNLDTLRFIGDAAVERGLQFQLGIWTHAYEWTQSPNANYTIGGLTPDTQGAYCRDALRTLLQACPAISGVTFRVHGESGVAEGSYDFWKTVFDGIVRCGRRVEIDMHAKGMDQRMIDVALATGMPVNVSPKFWAEHMGLPYHQAAIRAQEMPPRDQRNRGFFALSSGSRSFLRYGYGDLLAEDRRHGVWHRVWPGTQRLLLWGDPVFVASCARAFSFCGSAGVDVCEPLFFKGRKGSGLPGGRGAYADASLKPAGGDWEKYLYTYRIWGRLLYNPDADPDTWRRAGRKQFGAGAEAAEAALANASRILPLVTAAHCPSAANNNYWPEIYTNMSIVDATKPHPYPDTPSPKRFGTVSPLDPELFSRVDDFAAELLNGELSAKYSPAEVARWLETLAEIASRRAAEAEKKAGGRGSPEFRRLAGDVAIQAGLGRFFAWKLRAGVLYALFNRSGERRALEEALKAYRQARSAWAELAARARGVYVNDITFGYEKQLRGHWQDRLPAIDEDIADMEKRLPREKSAKSVPASAESKKLEQAIRAVLAPAPRPALRCEHTPPSVFRRGQPVKIELALADVGRGARLTSIRLRYRRVNQAELWCDTAMQPQANRHRAEIPGDYSDSPFPLQYFFELRDAQNRRWLHPGFAVDLANQPYFVVRQARQSPRRHAVTPIPGSATPALSSGTC